MGGPAIEPQPALAPAGADQQGLVEETGKMSTATGGRPAKLYRFRREILLERAVAGTKLPLSRSA